MGFVLVGAIGFVLGLFAARAWPGLRGRLGGGSVPVFDKGNAAVNPAHPDLPDAVDASEKTKIARIPHVELRELVEALRS